METTPLIGYLSSSGMVHSKARCGSGRSIYTSPFIFDQAEDRRYCQKCTATQAFEEATEATIAEAAQHLANTRGRRDRRWDLETCRRNFQSASEWYAKRLEEAGR